MSLTQRDIKLLWGRSGALCAICKAALAHDAAANELKQGRGALANDVRKHREAAGAATARAFEASNKSGGKYDRRPIEDAAVLSDQASEERHPETAARLHHQAGAAHGVAAEVHAKAGHREAAAAHRAASEEHRTVARRLHGLHMTGHVANVFCATGEGGGIDPSCKRDGSSGSRGEAVREAPPDHPHTASVEAGKHSDAAYEATRGLTGLQAVKRHASAARNAARRAAEATDPEDAGNNHLNAADAHQQAPAGEHDKEDRLQSEAMWAHRRAYATHLETAESLRKLARIGHTTNAHRTPNPEAA